MPAPPPPLLRPTDRAALEVGAPDEARMHNNIGGVLASQAPPQPEPAARARSLSPQP